MALYIQKHTAYPLTRLTFSPKENWETEIQDKAIVDGIVPVRKEQSQPKLLKAFLRNGTLHLHRCPANCSKAHTTPQSLGSAGLKNSVAPLIHTEVITFGE